MSGMSDHPRIRGEHERHRLPVQAVSGSSPHTRGAPGTLRLLYIQSRDHPRIRGEHALPTTLVTLWAGSSPHTRGARRTTRLGGAVLRIIPAYAGSTKIAQKGKGMAADHPRIRGEHSPSPSPASASKGSSPHTRGAPQNVMDGDPWPGIIPAYAGSTSAGRRPRQGRPDHPRIRGEHAARRSILRMSPGSSPHTRGALSDSSFV